MPNDSHLVRRLLTGAATTAAAAASAAVAAAAYGAHDLLDANDQASPLDIDVVAVHEDVVVLTATDDACREGTYALLSEDGARAVVGEIVGRGDALVRRRLISGSVTPGRAARLERSVWLEPPEELADAEEVRIPGDLGELPAWQVPGESTTWAIVVHGHGGGRARTLRVATAIRPLGLPQLLISWRNDGEAPWTADRRYHLGVTEWHDLDAAVSYALKQGARQVVLVGLSMGASIVGTFLRRSSNADRVRALVLDAPTLDWRATMHHAARARHLPPALTPLAAWLVQRRADLHLDDVDNLHQPPQGLSRPTLIFHGTEDQVVPVATSRDYAARHPDQSTFVEVRGAGHEDSWNVDRERYTSALRQFLEANVRVTAAAGS